MTFAITPVAAKDGNATTIVGGVDFIDTSGVGTGPWIITKVTIDPAGVNVQGVLSNGAAKTDLTSAAGTALSATANGLKVDGSAVTQPVSGTFFQATQPVSATSLPLPTGASTAANQSTLITAVGSPMQQTGGTVGIAAGTALVGSVEVTDGTNTMAVKPASTIAAATDPSAVMTLSPNSFGVLTSGTAGSPSTQVVSIQGVASGTVVPVSGTINTGASAAGGYTYNHISTATTTTIKSGSGTLHTVNINTLGTVASTITMYDNTAGSGTVIGILNSLTIGQGCYTYDIAFTTGLTLVTTGTVAPDVTVSYK